MDVVPLRPEQESPRQATFAGFDAIRAIAAIGVVLLHACVPYLKHPMPGLAWPVRDTASTFLDVLFWGIELFIMPVFLVLAGILAWQSLMRRGPGTLIKTRAKRLLTPLLFGMLIVLPLDLYAWVLGWVAEGVVPMVKLKSLKFDDGIDVNLWGLSHLWFLQYLFLYVAVLAATIAFAERRPIMKRWWPSTKVAATLMVATGTATLCFYPEVVWGFQHAFLPVGSKWLYSGTFFFGGVLIAQCDPQLTTLIRLGRRLVCPAVVLAGFTVLLGRWHLDGGHDKTASVLLAAMTTVSAWSVSLAIIALATKYVKRLPIAVQYLGAASFWVYVVHHPFMGLIHTDLKWLLPTTAPVIKAMIALIVCVGFSLLMYEGLVRKTKLGHWLGFAWSIPRIASISDCEAAKAGMGSPYSADVDEVEPRRAA